MLSSVTVRSNIAQATRTESAPHPVVSPAAAASTQTSALSAATAREAGLYALDRLAQMLPSCPVLPQFDNKIDRPALRQLAKMRLNATGAEAAAPKSILHDDFLRLTDAAVQFGIGNDLERVLLAARLIVEGGYPHPVWVMGFDHPYYTPLDHVVLWVQSTSVNDSFYIDPLMACMSTKFQLKLLGAEFDAMVCHPAAFSARHVWKFLYACWTDGKLTRWVPAATLKDAGGFRRFAEVTQSGGKARWKAAYSSTMPKNKGAELYLREVSQAENDRVARISLSQLIDNERPVSSGGGLVNALPVEAAAWALETLSDSVDRSPALSRLRGELGHEQKRIYYFDMLLTANLLDKTLEEYEQTDFERLTDLSAKWGTGNSTERCLLAAHMIAQQGYPHAMRLMRCDIPGDIASTHCFLLIEGAERALNFCIDPLIACLTPEEQQRYAGGRFAKGSDHPGAFHQQNAMAHLHCLVESNAGLMIRRVRSIPEARVIRAIAAIRYVRYVPHSLTSGAARGTTQFLVLEN